MVNWGAASSTAAVSVSVSFECVMILSLCIYGEVCIAGEMLLCGFPESEADNWDGCENSNGDADDDSNAVSGNGGDNPTADSPTESGGGATKEGSHCGEDGLSCLLCGHCLAFRSFGFLSGLNNTHPRSRGATLRIKSFWIGES